MAQTSGPLVTSDIPPDSVDEHVAGAFSVLASETRLEILFALWEMLDPISGDGSVPFSKLRKRVGISDSGQFNYHLEKLSGRFIRKTDGGYELRPTGRELVQTVIGGVGIEDQSLDPARIEKDCKYCGGTTELVYRDQILIMRCTNCAGCLGDEYGLPDGTIAARPFEPAGLLNRSPEAVYHAAFTPGILGWQAACEGICSTCSGSVEATIHICADHAGDGICGECGRVPEMMAHFICPICKSAYGAPPYKLVAHHPAVIGFYYDRGVMFQYDVRDSNSLRRRENLVATHDQTLISRDPLRVRVSIAYEGDELQLVVDETMDVVDVTESI